MFNLFLNKERIYSAEIDAQNVQISSQQTLLSAALENGINIPNQCRVGSCQSCKCQLVSGNIIPMIDFDYVLDEADLKNNMILACQSIAKSNLKIALINDTKSESQRAEVLAQNRLSDSIVELVIKSDKPFSFTPGQYTDLTFDDYPHLTRTYSFASQANLNTVSFLIQKVPSGAFSNLVHEQNLLGKSLSLSAANGRFVLDNSTAPLLFLVAGSGLAPALSMLMANSDRLRSRPVSLYVGARQHSDLIKRQEISRLQALWKNTFDYIPVLSCEVSAITALNDQPIHQGYVSEHLPKDISAFTQAYVCGSENFVDSCLSALDTAGVSRDRTYVDTFVASSFQPNPNVAPMKAINEHK